MSEEDNKEGVLSRWSKRKRELADAPEEKTAAVASQEEQDAELEARELELAANREAAEEIDLDTIDEDSDLSLFMKEGVPEALKKAALAKLWRSNPVFANIDGLVDYDDNFADPNLIMKTFTSAYQVGKGYLKEVLEEEEEVAEVSVAKNEETPDETEPLQEVETLTDLEETSSEESIDTIASSEPELPLEVETPATPNVPLRIRLGLAEISD